MNEIRDLYSSIEHNVLYNMHQFVLSPTVILKEVSVNNIWYENGPGNFRRKI